MSVADVLDLLSAVDVALATLKSDGVPFLSLANLLAPAWVDGCAIGLLKGDRLLPVCAVGIARGSTPTRTPAELNSARCEEGVWVIDAPIAVADHRFGVLRLSSTLEPPKSLTKLASEIARRMAIAFDNWERLQREREIASSLQRAFVPERFPKIEGSAIDAAYRPATNELAVGGDWYDAFELPDGRIGLSVGDVTGSGLDAAVLMGEVRQTVQAAALTTLQPSEILVRTNAMLKMRSIETMVTAVFGVYNPFDSSLTYACAGHPAPIIGLPDGYVQELPYNGMPLGVFDEIAVEDFTVTLFPDSLLVIYTDGLVEAQKNILEGQKILVDAIAEELSAKSELPAHTLHDRIFSQSPNVDDVATLTLRRSPDVAARFDCTFTAVPSCAPLIRRGVEQYAVAAGFDAERRFALTTSVGEAVANVIEHAYSRSRGMLRVRAGIESGAVHWTIEDFGAWRAPANSSERGLGIPMMRTLMDKVELQATRSGTTVKLRLRLV